MEQNNINASLFYINVGDTTSISLKRNEWILSEKLTSSFLEELGRKKCKVAFIKRENIFSHGMNVLRKLLNDTHIIAVIGVEDLYIVLQNAEECNLNIINDTISIGNTEYKFRSFNFIRDTSEIMEYNIDTEEICYRPDYYYSKELSSIIVAGYNMANMMLPGFHMARCDSDGRVWDKGFIFPRDFFDYFWKHLDEYYNNLLKYVNILETLFSLRTLTEYTEELKNSLISHYSYSVLFSFIIPNISEALQNVVGKSGVENVQQCVVLNSPILNKGKLTEQALKKLDYFLRNILNGVTNKDNFIRVYKIVDIPQEEIVLMYFVTNILADIRRCVINIILEDNHWFGSVYKHRKRVTMY